MNKSAKFISEGGSSHRPPLFEGDDYYYWKDKMKLFLRSQDTHMWTVIEVGDYAPLVKDSPTPKTKDEMTTQEADRVLLNTKAQLFIKSALCREEYDKIMECKTAKEMWTTLQTHHEGTSRVKETRIDTGVRKFELFEMKEDESIDQMYGRFTIIINELNSLGKKFSIHERVRKVLRCLPKSWRHIVTAITESKDLTEVKLEDLIGSLKAHESILQEDKPMKNKMIALDSQTKERSKNKEVVEEDNKFLQEDDEEELAFLSRRIQKLMMRRNQIKKNFPPRRNGSKPEVDVSKIQCYGCNQFGHYKNECPKQKNSPYKSMMVTWDELDEVQEAEEEQEANVCLMTNANIEEVTLDPCSSCQKTEHLFDNLLYDSQILNSKNGQLRDEVTKLTKERDEYKSDNDIMKEIIKNMQLAHEGLSKQIKELRDNQKIKEYSMIQKENIILKQKVSKLEKDLTKFVSTTETFENILGSQVNSYSRNGLGYKPFQNKKLIENVFVPHKEKRFHKYKCTFCHKDGHLEPFCFKKKSLYRSEHSQNNLKRNLYSTPPYKRSSYQYKKMPYKSTNLQGPKKLWECHLAMKKKPWYLDSGCSRHMTGDRQSFLSFEKKEGGTVTFGNNEKASIRGKGTIGKNNSAKIENVHYVEGLKHNLISISQLCDNDLEVIFRSHTCEIKQSDKTLFYGSRIKNVYVIYLDELPTESCFVSLERDKWIRHKRAGHISMKTMSKLSKLDLVRGLPDISFDLDKVCESCAKGKQVKSSFKPKDFVSTKRPLELLHIDLFGPVKTTSLGGKNYGFVIVDDFSRFTWIEPRSINEAITDESWIEAMKEELLQFEKNEVWNLVPLPQNHSIIFKSKKAKSYDSSKIRRSSRIMSGIGTGKKPMVDNTVHTIHDSDSNKTISDSELEKIVLEPLTSSKSVPAKHSPVSIKKGSATAVKAPKKKSLPRRKRPQAELLEVPLIHPEEEAKFEQYWKIKPVASGRVYDFEEISKGGVDLLKFVEPLGWTKFFQMKDTIMPLKV
ncbi:uncharacterized protein LOC123886217 [Trifolium pratense]|uniref:uncharacterized protein LOC123886217 n=1 Tax=Trifolium pratense TaxID=57577 RepID=UPI001E690DFB|nr:uncharacterized protein LOC123886217 [Trifolium pratense]